MNISLANVLLYNVGKISSGKFQETSFKSDVQAVEGMFNDTVLGFVDQSYRPTAHYDNATANVAEVSPNEHLVLLF